MENKKPRGEVARSVGVKSYLLAGRRKIVSLLERERVWEGLGKRGRG